MSPISAPALERLDKVPFISFLHRFTVTMTLLFLKSNFVFNDFLVVAIYKLFLKYLPSPCWRRNPEVKMNTAGYVLL